MITCQGTEMKCDRSRHESGLFFSHPIRQPHVFPDLATLVAMLLLLVGTVDHLSKWRPVAVDDLRNHVDGLCHTFQFGPAEGVWCSLTTLLSRSLGVVVLQAVCQLSWRRLRVRERRCGNWPKSAANAGIRGWQHGGCVRRNVGQRHALRSSQTRFLLAECAVGF